MRDPLPAGTHYKRSTIEKVVDIDESDDDMPYRYLLKDGNLVWIPANYQPPSMRQGPPPRNAVSDEMWRWYLAEVARQVMEGEYRVG